MLLLGGSKIILMLNDSSIQETVVENSGAFKIENIKPGLYKIKIKVIGYREGIRDSIKVLANLTTGLNLNYPFPCKFNYVDGEKPKCPKGHTDEIIPTVYGLPSTKTMKSLKKGKVFLGGCMVTDCDPKFYCKRHKIEL